MFLEVKAARVCVPLLLAHGYFTLEEAVGASILLVLEEPLLYPQGEAVAVAERILPDYLEHLAQEAAEEVQEVTLHNPAVLAALES
jgi:hypothetical protein